MWRSSRKVYFRKSLLYPSPHSKTSPHVRLQSTSSGGSGKVALATVGALTLGVGGTLAYAKYDSGFRSRLESSIPFIDSVLKYLPDLGSDSSPSSKPPQPLPPEKLKEKALESSLLKKKIDREAAKDNKPAAVSPSTSTSVKKEKTTPSPKELEDEAQRRQKQVEVEKERLNFNLEQHLREGQESVKKATQDAVNANIAAKEAIQIYTEKLYRALDEALGTEDHFLWEDVAQAKNEKLAALKKASVKTNDAKIAMNLLEETIKKGREKKETQNNLALSPAEHTAEKLKEDLKQVADDVSAVQESARIASDYKQAIEKGKKHFQDELAALLPDKKFGEPGIELTEDELNILVAHAHRRVEYLLRQLLKLQVTEEQRAQAFSKQQFESSKELERQKAQIDATLEVKLNQQKEEFEQELQQQLRRQVTAHTEHLREALYVQQKELEREHQLDLEGKLIDERASHSTALSSSVSKLQGLEGYLKARDELDRVSRQAKQMWLACQILKHTLVYGRSSKDAPQPLSNEIIPISEAAINSPYVSTVLASIPEEALKRGVYPEVALKERFTRVEKVCRRVAMIDENGGGLLKYLLSYVQSLFIVYPKELPEEEITDEQRVNPAMWDTFDILSRVKYWLLHENLEQALRYANQLKGEPRNVASDWIKEVRLLLETRQAASALMAFAAATIAEDVQ